MSGDDWGWPTVKAMTEAYVQRAAETGAGAPHELAKILGLCSALASAKANPQTRLSIKVEKPRRVAPPEKAEVPYDLLQFVITVLEKRPPGHPLEQDARRLVARLNAPSWLANRRAELRAAGCKKSASQAREEYGRLHNVSAGTARNWESRGTVRR